MLRSVIKSLQFHFWQLCSSGTVTPDGTPGQTAFSGQLAEVHVSTEKVCSQALPLPDGVHVVDVVPAAGHLSSSSIFPACLAPYLLVTACSDDTVRFWRTKLVTTGIDHNEATFEWEEWQMESAEGHLIFCPI